MTTGPDDDPDNRPTAAASGPPRRTVPLTPRRVIGRPARASPDPDALEQDRVDRFWRDRRRVGRLLWGLIALSVVVQVVGLLLPEGFGALAGALVLAPYPALLLTAGLLAPRPPTGFFRRAPAASSPGAGLDSLTFALIAAAVVTGQVLAFWMPSSDPGVVTSVGITLATFGLGVILMLGALGLRERRHRRRQRTPPAQPS